MNKSKYIAAALALGLTACSPSSPPDKGPVAAFDVPTAAPDAKSVWVFVVKDHIIVSQEPNLHVGESGLITIRWHIALPNTLGKPWEFQAPSDPHAMIKPAASLPDQNCGLAPNSIGGTKMDLLCTYTLVAGKYTYDFSVINNTVTPPKTVATDPSIRN